MEKSVRGGGENEKEKKSFPPSQIGVELIECRCTACCGFLLRFRQKATCFYSGNSCQKYIQCVRIQILLHFETTNW